METVALVISICAFIVSVVVPIFEFIWNKKMNKLNLEAEYFRDIYGEIMYQKIPRALNYFHFDGSKLSGTDDMINVLREIRMRSIYFQVIDKDFYDSLKESVQDLEDYIIKTPDEMSATDFAGFVAKANEMVQVIYEKLSNKYIGHKS